MADRLPSLWYGEGVKFSITWLLGDSTAPPVDPAAWSLPPRQRTARDAPRLGDPTTPPLNLGTDRHGLPPSALRSARYDAGVERFGLIGASVSTWFPCRAGCARTGRAGHPARPAPGGPITNVDTCSCRYLHYKYFCKFQAETSVS